MTSTTAFVAFALLGLSYRCQSQGFPPAPEVPGVSEGKEGFEKAKKEADDLELTEDQFFQCFTDINCNLGPDFKQEMFDCYTINTPEDMKSYTQWFADCPKGNFTDLDMVGINTEFCSLNPEDQREVNDHFLAAFRSDLASICKEKKNFARCNRLRKAGNCMTRLVKEKVISKDCKTAFDKVPSMPGM